MVRASTITTIAVQGNCKSTDMQQNINKRLDTVMEGLQVIRGYQIAVYVNL